MFSQINKTLTAACDCFRSITEILYDFSDELLITKELKPRLINISPWLFDFTEPWKSPVHYPQAHLKIKGRSATVKKNFTTYKQPIAKSGFKRGQRN